jgi:hypothetical protein
VQSTIEAVARYFATTWQSAEGPPDAYLTIRGRKIALDVAVIAQQSPRGKPVAKARLREDKVAQRVIRDLETALSAHVPNGRSLILTLGAPIKLPNKLVVSLTTLFLAYLEGGAKESDEKRQILGNRVRFRVTHSNSKWAAKVMGFVFTGDPAPAALATTMHSLHDEIATQAKRRMPKTFPGERWLVLQNDNWVADLKTFRRAYPQFSPPHDFSKILMVSDRGRVEVLAEA